MDSNKKRHKAKEILQIYKGNLLNLSTQYYLKTIRNFSEIFKKSKNT